RDPGRELLGGPGNLGRPRVVAEVALDLADDGRDGERGEARAPLDVEALDGLDEALEGHLLQVVERLAPAREPPRQAAREAHVLGHQRVPAVGGRVLPVGPERLQLALRLSGLHHVEGCSTAGTSTFLWTTSATTPSRRSAW